ncbi:MAG: Mbeg1-like protein [Myxococcota bacterium]
MPKYADFHDRAGNKMTFLEILDLCKQSYNDLQNQRKVQIAGQEMSVENNRVSGGFAAYKIKKPNGWTAIVFRGSDDWRDWVLNNVPGAVLPVPPPQYGTGRQFAKQHDDNCVLVGHSLGGGIASYAAAQNGQHAATIFPAPINPVWLTFPLPVWPAKGTTVQNYVCSGEVLTVAAAASLKMRRYGTDVWVESTGGGPIEKHALTAIKT